jgi:drug/metabolite transporter (DMT)-like permease
MELWILLAVAAAFFQNLRFMLQKVLSGSTLSAAGATFARFIYAAPLVGAGLFALLAYRGQPLPDLGPGFWTYALIGGLTQILATLCVVALFAHRNFAVGVTLMKSEVLMTVLLGLLVLNDTVSTLGFLAMLLGVVGVLLLAQMPQATGPLWRRIWTRSTGLGLASGALFSVSSVFYRGASLSVDSDDPLLRAVLTLTVVCTAQAFGMALWLRWREVGQITRVLRGWRTSGLVGVTSLAGSLCWFTAFTLQNAAYVKAVGQVELLFSILASVLFFKERIAAREGIGLAVLSVAIVGIVLAG